MGVGMPILGMMKGEDYGMEFVQVLIKQLMCIYEFVFFVDDVDLIQAVNQDGSRDELLLRAEATLTQWEEGIFATGGKVVHTKVIGQ